MKQELTLSHFHSYYKQFSNQHGRSPQNWDEMKQAFRGDGGFELILEDVARLNVNWGTPLETTPPAILATIDAGKKSPRSVLTDETIVVHRDHYKPNANKK